MVKKKLNPMKGTKTRGDPTMAEDVRVHTGLPPKVDGQIRCFCKVSVNQVLWSMPSPPFTIVQLKWWGEEGNGAFFRPVDIKKGSTSRSSVSTTGRYPVRSGPKQLGSYLKDMRALSFAVYTSEAAKEPAGHSLITEIGQLSNNRPINGFFSIVSPNGKKIGELQVSIMLESLMASYDDKMGSIPTTDLTTNPRHSQESMLPSVARPRPHSQQPIKPQEDPFISPASASHLAEDASLLAGARTHNAADLKQRLNYDLADGSQSCRYPVAITTNGDVVGMSDLHGNGVPMVNGQARPPSVPRGVQGPAQGEQGGGSGDLLSVLLNRGTELRQAMVVSSLGQSQEHERNNSNLDGQPAAALAINGSAAAAAEGVPTYSPARGVLVDNLLAQSGGNPVDMLLGSPVGKHEWQMLQMLNGGSPGLSICSEGMEDMASEPGDPLHDRTLLQELFYKRSDSELSELSGLSGDEGSIKQGSLKDAGNARPPSRCSSMSSLTAALPAPAGTPTKKRKRKSRANSVSSDPPKTVRKSRSRSRSRSLSKERNPRMTKTVTAATGKKPKSKSRSRSRSRSLSQKRKSSISDSDTPRSEISRVSFDPVPSDVDDELDDHPQEKQVDGLSVERLTLLGRVHVARVNVLDLCLHGRDLDLSSSSKSSSRSAAKRTGKPPRPVKSRKPCTYLIEYQFPVVATSRDKHSPNAMATEVMRVASKTVSNGVVSFSHRSVFPLMFDGAALEKWWKSALVFKVYSREAGQKAPVLLGSCGVPLKSILKADDLHLARELEIQELGRNSSLNNSARSTTLNSPRSGTGALLGTLKVSVELASDHKDFATSLARTRVAEMSSSGRNIVPVVPPSPPPAPAFPLPPPPTSPGYPAGKSRQSARKNSPLRSAGSERPMKPPSLPVNQPHSLFPSSIVQEYSKLHKPTLQAGPVNQASAGHETMTLHTLILIPEGCNLSVHGVPPLHMVSRNPALLQQQLVQHTNSGTSGRDQMTRNTYLVCRMFWSNDSVHSNVCWGSLNPQYNFAQVAPVLVTPTLLERMRNNYMVIEVWDKKTSAESDKLIGMTKLSLHQFFMSFRDPKISGALLRSEYPVVAIDNYMPVVDPFSGLHFGQLSVLLAMGSAEQVASLQRLKCDREAAAGVGPQRPNLFLERQDVYGPGQGNVRLDSTGTSVEHAFEVVIQGVRGLKLLETMIWGEADCFVQYFFPAQSSTSGQQGPTVVMAMPTLRSFRTATTLCIPDPTFHDVTRHRVTLPVGTPVQRELLTACANSSGGSGGLPFEVWCRFYHPNVRDQVIARAVLPLAKLCAMVTMQKRGEPSVQSFSLPLTPVAADSTDAEGQAKMKDSGLMDVTVHYKTQKVEAAVGTSINQPTSGSQVFVSVSIIRASGLKAAAEMCARSDSGMQYPAEVGVNAYVRLRLSFLGNQEEKVTKTVARTFSPEFSHHVEFPLQLLWSGDHGDAASLAQMLETGQAEFEVWHQVPGMIPGVTEYECDDATGGKRMVQTSGDVLLGTCTVPLTQLLARHAGVKGWFPVDRPSSASSTTWERQTPDSAPSQSSPRMVGGLELSLHFAHTSDRLRVVEAARSVGWSPVDPVVELEEWQEEEGGEKQQRHQVVVSVDRVSVPLHRVLLPAQEALDPSARCYVRYKFYDRAAVVSRTSRLQGEGERVQATLHHRHTMILPHSAPFQWYLREEQLEVQVWVTFGGRDKSQRPLQRDKLVGTAYVDVLPLADTRRRQHRISGLLPLFKPGAANLDGAFVQLHLTSNLCRGNQMLEDEDDVLENGDVSDADYDSSDSFHQLAGGGGKSSPVKRGRGHAGDKEVADLGPVFTVRLAVERAMHLPTVRVTGRSGEVAPTSYISYQSADKTSPSHSDIVPNTINPVWDYNAEVTLSDELLTHDNKNLVLKVWHKPEGSRKQPDKASDRVLGFVSVDLSPLNSGLRMICGWYNIVDFNGQSKGQIKVSITPVDMESAGGSNVAVGPSTSMISSRGGSLCQPGEPVAGFSFFPSEGAPLSLPVPGAQVSLHWQPRFATLSVPGDAGGGDSSKSMLFSSLRQQLRDLDGLTQRLRLRLSCDDSDIDANQPASARSADILMGTHSGLSTIHTTSSMTGTREVLSDVSRQLLASRDLSANTSQQNGGGGGGTVSEDTSHNAVDSGAFSGNNTGKSQDGPDSHRSGGVGGGGDGKQTLDGGGGAGVLFGRPPTGTSATMMEAQFLSEASQGGLTPRSPRDFSSHSQHSQGFQPMASAIPPSDSSASGSSRVKGQKVPSLTNLTAEDDDSTPQATERSGAPALTHDEAREYHQNPAAYGEGEDDSSQEDEMYGSYHHYRAMLDREEEENPPDDEENEDGSNVQVVMPRRINDVSGMLRQYAQNSGTLPPIFPPPDQLRGGGDEREAASAFLQTWPSRLLLHGDPEAERGGGGSSDRSRGRDSKGGAGLGEEEMGERPGARQEDVRADRADVLGVQDRNSFIDSWLEDSAELVSHEANPVRSATQPRDAVADLVGSLHDLDLDLDLGGGEEAERGSGKAKTPRGRSSGSESEGKPPSAGGMHLLSNVELLDTFASVTSVNKRKNGNKKHSGASSSSSSQARGQASQGGKLRDRDLAMMPGASLPGDGGDDENQLRENNSNHNNNNNNNQFNRHLLSNVELHSTIASSVHQAAVPRPPRHLLSNVDLASTASGGSSHSHPADSATTATSSGRPSRQSSANSGRQRAGELESCPEADNSMEETRELDDLQGQGRLDHQLHQLHQPLSARSEGEVSDFFAAVGGSVPGLPQGQAKAVNGGGGFDDSSDEELEEYLATSQGAARARAARAVQSRPPAAAVTTAAKGRDPCHSVTGMTEDSGLESGAKSSQDEREALSLLDSTQGQGHPDHTQGHHLDHSDFSQVHGNGVPEFFLPTEQLQASMRALQMATSAAANARDDDAQASRLSAKVQASSDLVNKLKKTGTSSGKFNGTISTKSRQLPTAEEAKRIAKIFSAKPS